MIRATYIGYSSIGKEYFGWGASYFPPNWFPPGNLTYFDSYLVLGVISLLIILILRNLLEPKSKKAETTPRIM
jgi:hypothetical protein